MTVINHQAADILELSSPEDALGKQIREVLPGAKLTRILSGGEQRSDDELIIGDKAMIINTVPMISHGQINGAVASFRSKDEIDIMAKQLSQVKEYSDLLRAQTHEYSNKLHTIAGLIQIGHDKEALDLISKESAGYQGLIAFWPKRSLPGPGSFYHRQIQPCPGTPYRFPDRSGQSAGRCSQRPEQRKGTDYSGKSGRQRF